MPGRKSGNHSITGESNGSCLPVPTDRVQGIWKQINAEDVNLAIKSIGKKKPGNHMPASRMHGSNRSGKNFSGNGPQRSPPRAPLEMLTPNPQHASQSSS